MTDEQAERIVDELVDIWGDKLPNPDHEPLRFKYYLKMFRYCHPDRLQKALDGKRTDPET